MGYVPFGGTPRKKRQRAKQEAERQAEVDEAYEQRRREDAEKHEREVTRDVPEHDL